MPDILISHGFCDKGITHRTRDLLRAHGLTVWTYENLRELSIPYSETERVIQEVWAVVAISFISLSPPDCVERDVAIANRLEKRVYFIKYTCDISRVMTARLEGAYAEPDMLTVDVALERLAMLLRQRKLYERSIAR